VVDFVRELSGKDECTVLVSGDRTTAVEAAFANGSMAHAFELDDTHFAGGHPGCGIIPAALAIGEREKATGKGLLTSIVIGYDVHIRIAKAVRPGLFLRGFCTSSTIGSIACAAVVSKILGLDQEKTAHALGIAKDLTCGTINHQWDPLRGGDCVRIEGGSAARNGVMSGLLADKGFKSESTSIEGEAGFCRTFSDTVNLSEITDRLGKRFYITEVLIKPYACCSQMNSAIDAVTKIMENHEFGSEEVEEVKIYTNEIGVKTTSKYEPQDLTAAQFSMPFSIALRLIKRSNFIEDYTEENLKSQEVLGMMKKVKVLLAPNYKKMFPYFSVLPVKAEITLRNGATYEKEVVHSKGTPQNPMSKEEILQKFRSLASTVMPDATVRKGIEIIGKAETFDDVSDLTKMFTQVI